MNKYVILGKLRNKRKSKKFSFEDFSANLLKGAGFINIVEIDVNFGN